MGWCLSERVGFLGNAHWDVFFSKNVSDPVIEFFRNVRYLKVGVYMNRSEI